MPAFPVLLPCVAIKSSSTTLVNRLRVVMRGLMHDVTIVLDVKGYRRTACTLIKYFRINEGYILQCCLSEARYKLMMKSVTNSAAIQTESGASVR